MMQAMGQKNVPELQPTLEINPDHEIIRKLLADPQQQQRLEDAGLATLRPGTAARRRAA